MRYSCYQKFVSCFSLSELITVISPVKVISNEVHRFPRRVATLQINLHWDHIVTLAQKNDIPKKNIGVRVDYDTLPFQIRVFDYHELLDDTKHLSSHVLVANEVDRRHEKGLHDCVVLLLRVVNAEVPCVVYLNDLWAESFLNAPGGTDDEGTVYIDQDGNALTCKNIDPLRAGVRFARENAALYRLPVWSEGALSSAAADVNGVFTNNMVHAWIFPTRRCNTEAGQTDELDRSKMIPTSTFTLFSCCFVRSQYPVFFLNCFG